MSAAGLAEDVVGHRWLLIEIRTQAGTHAIEPSMDEAWLDLGADGRLAWYDTINYISGNFAVRGNELVVSGGLWTTLASGPEPGRSVVFDAFSDLFVALGGGGESRLPVDVVDLILQVHVGADMMLFRRAGSIR